ncbi:MAG: Hsp33 family molecular chaperone HslO, partial [Akkermansiaceae bacterium]
WVSHFYDQSEQRPGKAFRLPNDEYALIAAQPDFDEEWFESLTPGTVSAITDSEQTKQLETRRFRFKCGCSLERIAPTLKAWKEKPDELFGDDDTLTIQCPRCAQKYQFSREDLENQD